jgi:hypothetical protein
MKKLFPLIFVSLIATVGCNSGGSDKKKEVEIAEVHHIKPKDVSAYIENYQSQQQALNLEFKGADYNISLIDFDMEENIILAKFELGVVYIGFDFDKEAPINSLTVLEATNINDLENSVTASYSATDLSITEQDDNFVYAGDLIDAQSNGLFNVSLTFNESLISGGNSDLTIQDDMAYLSGTLGSKTYVQINELINQNPSIKTIKFISIDGSVNDAINMHTGRSIRNAQLTTYMPSDGEAYSGGVDLFVSGYKRKYEAGGKLGVHSWCCEAGKAADQLGKDHPGHGAQLTFFRELLGNELGPEFYFYTINAASFDNVHIMSEAELNKYQLITD